MSSIQIIQIMAILYFLYALRMKVWQTSLNTFVVLAAFFIVTVSREFEICRDIWIDYHLTIVAVAMTFLMGRVVYQSVRKKYIDRICNDCTNFNRRKDDNVQIS